MTDQVIVDTINEHTRRIEALECAIAQRPLLATVTVPKGTGISEYYRVCPDCGKSVLWGRMGPKEYHDCKGGTVAADKPALILNPHGPPAAGNGAGCLMTRVAPISADQPAEPFLGAAHQSELERAHADQPAGDDAVRALQVAIEAISPASPWNAARACVAAIRRGEVPVPHEARVLLSAGYHTTVGNCISACDAKEERLTEQDAEIADLRAKLAEAKRERDEAREKQCSQLRAVCEQRDKALARVAELKRERESWKQTGEHLRELNNAAQERVRELTSENAEAGEVIGERVSERDKALAELAAMEEKLTKHMNDNPLTKTDADYLTERLKEAAGLERDLKEAKREIQKWNDTCAAVQQTNAQLKAELAAAQDSHVTQINAMTERAEDFKKQLAEVEANMNGLETEADEVFALLGGRSGEDGDEELFIVANARMGDLRDAQNRADAARAEADAANQEGAKFAAQAAAAVLEANALRARNEAMLDALGIVPPYREDAALPAMLAVIAASATEADALRAENGQLEDMQRGVSRTDFDQAQGEITALKIAVRNCKLTQDTAEAERDALKARKVTLTGLLQEIKTNADRLTFNVWYATNSHRIEAALKEGTS